MTSVSAGHIILTPTKPVGSGRSQQESNPGPPHQESCALPQSYRAPNDGDDDDGDDDDDDDGNDDDKDDNDPDNTITVTKKMFFFFNVKRQNTPGRLKVSDNPPRDFRFGIKRRRKEIA